MHISCKRAFVQKEIKKTEEKDFFSSYKKYIFVHTRNKTEHFKSDTFVEAKLKVREIQCEIVVSVS